MEERGRMGLEERWKKVEEWGWKIGGRKWKNGVGREVEERGRMGLEEMWKKVEEWGPKSGGIGRRVRREKEKRERHIFRLQTY